MIRPSTKSLLIRFPHGLGDCVQLLHVLDQLREAWPDLAIDVQVRPGCEGLFAGHCRSVFRLDDPAPIGACDHVVRLHWPEAGRCYEGLPGTKATRTLIEVFGVMPRVVRPTLELEAWPMPMPRGRRVVLHYQGHSSKDRKDLPEDVVRRLVEFLLDNGVRVDVLDWDRTSTLPDGAMCRRADLPKDGAMTASLIDQADLFIGIDSGPAKLAQLTATRSLVVWTGMHPYHFAEPVGEVTHLVPADHLKLLRGDDITPGAEYFGEHYQHETYHSDDMAEALIAQAAKVLGLDRPSEWSGLTATSYGEQYYREHKSAGLDYLAYGDWQRDYAWWLVDAMDLEIYAGGKPAILDLGCACGAIAQGFHDAECDVHGTDLNNHMIDLGRERFPDLKLDVCDAANLHLFPDKHFDFVHSAQVFEHFRPELVPYILAELYRVLKPGGVLFTAHDTVELYTRQDRQAETEDPTHLCLWPRMLWDLAFEDAGFRDVSEAAGEALRAHPKSFLKRYDWDWWALARPG